MGHLSFVFSYLLICVDVELFRTVDEAAQSGVDMFRAAPNHIWNAAVSNAGIETLSPSVTLQKIKRGEFNTTETKGLKIALQQAIYEVTMLQECTSTVDTQATHLQSFGGLHIEKTWWSNIPADWRADEKPPLYVIPKEGGGMQFAALGAVFSQSNSDFCCHNHVSFSFCSCSVSGNFAVLSLEWWRTDQNKEETLDSIWMKLVLTILRRKLILTSSTRNMIIFCARITDWYLTEAQKKWD